jgi:hypothetical protein
MKDHKKILFRPRRINKTVSKGVVFETDKLAVLRLSNKGAFSRQSARFEV